jgi:hypothetical protein
MVVEFFLVAHLFISMATYAVSLLPGILTGINRTDVEKFTFVNGTVTLVKLIYL